jgi:hypothetical protein
MLGEDGVTDVHGFREAPALVEEDAAGAWYVHGDEGVQQPGSEVERVVASRYPEWPCFLILLIVSSQDRTPLGNGEEKNPNESHAVNAHYVRLVLSRTQENHNLLIPILNDYAIK